MVGKRIFPVQDTSPVRFESDAHKFVRFCHVGLVPSSLPRRELEPSFLPAVAQRVYSFSSSQCSLTDLFRIVQNMERRRRILLFRLLRSP